MLTPETEIIKRTLNTELKHIKKVKNLGNDRKGVCRKKEQNLTKQDRKTQRRSQKHMGLKVGKDPNSQRILEEQKLRTPSDQYKKKTVERPEEARRSAL